MQVITRLLLRPPCLRGAFVFAVALLLDPAAVLLLLAAAHVYR
jgi:hypothetical protein